jgi:hypothetical protein
MNSHGVMVRVRVFNVSFNNISVISWWSVLFGGVLEENHCFSRNNVFSIGERHRKFIFNKFLYRYIK